MEEIDLRAEEENRIHEDQKDYSKLKSKLTLAIKVMEN